MMREAIADVSELALLDILLDRVQGFFFGDLWFITISANVFRPIGKWSNLADLHLCVGPSGNLDDHVQDGLLLIGVEWDVMER